MSVIPCWHSNDHSSVTEYLAAANGSKVPLYETVELELSLKLNRTFKWRFQKAKVRFAILGINFLAHFRLTVSPHTGTLQCVETESQIPTAEHT